eukprot:g28921.t1
MSSTRRVTAISCNECPTPELRMKCGCVGNTGFNTDRFLDWAAKHLPPSHRPRQVVIVEESYLVRRVSATVLGRLFGFGYKTLHNQTTMNITVVNARESQPHDALNEMMEVHEAMPSLENYSTGAGGAPQLFPADFILGEATLPAFVFLERVGLCICREIQRKASKTCSVWPKSSWGNTMKP